MSAAPGLVADFSAAEIEAGRRLFAGEWEFRAAAGSLEVIPAPGRPEIAFAGRSNVGKSSLINALTGRRALARTSGTPGRTQELIFFSGGAPLVLVDLPGYGYAAAAKSRVSAWTRLVRDYLRSRSSLLRVYLLVDGRHGLKAADLDVLTSFDEAALSYQAVLTKTDQVGSAEIEERLASVNTALARRPAAFPGVLMTSARTGAGIPELRAAISRLLAERG